MKTKELKQKMLNALEGKFEVTEIIKDWDKNGELLVNLKFIFKGREGKGIYYLTGYNSPSIEKCDFEEQKGEDIYEEIYKWIEKHLQYSQEIKIDGKEI